jgi:IMP cyclohydrolase
VAVLADKWYKPEDITRICCNSRISYTCVRIVEEL